MRPEERIAPVGSAHLTDEELMDTYVLGGESRHLGGCGLCKSRFEKLARALGAVRDDATREADSIFTADRLRDQRDRIMRRIERHVHPAEVVMFPTPQNHTGMPRVLAPVRRWIAAAAATGLAAGMFLGFVMDRGTHYAAVNQAGHPSSVVAPAASWPATDARDDQFFSEIEDALMGSRTIELLALDAMTTPVEIREASYPR